MADKKYSFEFDKDFAGNFEKGQQVVIVESEKLKSDVLVDYVALCDKDTVFEHGHIVDAHS